MNGDGIVNATDTLDVLAGYGSTGNNALDINRDFVVDQIGWIWSRPLTTQWVVVVAMSTVTTPVNSTDVLESLSLTGESTNAADLNRDGDVTVHDVRGIRVKWVRPLAVSSWGRNG